MSWSASGRSPGSRSRRPGRREAGAGSHRVRALARVRDVLGDPLGADPRLRPVRGGAGGRLQGRDEPAAARRLAPLAGDRLRAWRGVLVVLLRRGRLGPLDLPQGRQLHRRDGLPVRLHQPGDRAGHHHGGASRLAVHRGRVRRRAADDRLPRPAVQGHAAPQPGRAGPPPGRPGHRRAHGGPRRHGHGRHHSRIHLVTAPLAVGVHRHQPVLRDGLGVDLGRYRGRPAGRRRAGRVGAATLLARLVPRRPPAAGQAVGAAGRPAGLGPVVRLLDRQRAAGRGAVEPRHQLRRGGGVHLRRPDRPADPQHLPQVLRLEDGRLPAADLLRGDGRGRPGGRAAVRGGRAGPGPARRQGRRGERHLELHHRPQPRLPGPGRGAGGALRADRRRADAADDGRAAGRIRPIGTRQIRLLPHPDRSRRWSASPRAAALTADGSPSSWSRAARGGAGTNAAAARATATASSGAYGTPSARSATSMPPASAPTSAAGAAPSGARGSASTTMASRNSPSDVAGTSTASTLVCPASSRRPCRPRWAAKNPATSGRRPERHAASASAAAARNAAVHPVVSPAWPTCRIFMRAANAGIARTASAATASGASGERADRQAATRSSPATRPPSRYGVRPSARSSSARTAPSAAATPRASQPRAPAARLTPTVTATTTAAVQGAAPRPNSPRAASATVTVVTPTSAPGRTGRGDQPQAPPTARTAPATSSSLVASPSASTASRPPNAGTSARRDAAYSTSSPPTTTPAATAARREPGARHSAAASSSSATPAAAKTTPAAKLSLACSPTRPRWTAPAAPSATAAPAPARPRAVPGAGPARSSPAQAATSSKASSGPSRSSCAVAPPCTLASTWASTRPLTRPATRAAQPGRPAPGRRGASGPDRAAACGWSPPSPLGSYTV